MENEINESNELNEPAPKYSFLSPQEYLAMERASELRHEYYDGHVQAMSGASKQHNRINRNLVIEIGQYLKGQKCNVYTNEMRVSTPSHTTYMYPDVLIYCGEDLYEDDEFDTLLNPTVIFEILSPSTQRFDKGRKFHFYQEIPPFKEYFMIDSRKRMIYVYRKQIDNSWKLETIDEKTISLSIETIDFALPLDEIYRDTGL